MPVGDPVVARRVVHREAPQEALPADVPGVPAVAGVLVVAFPKAGVPVAAAAVADFSAVCTIVFIVGGAIPPVVRPVAEAQADITVAGVLAVAIPAARQVVPPAARQADTLVAQPALSLVMLPNTQLLLCQLKPLLWLQCQKLAALTRHLPTAC